MKLKPILANLALLFGSIFVCFLIFEFIVFKYIFNTSDAIPNTSINNIVRYVPDSRATLFEPDGTSHTVEINKQGWNSTKPTYKIEKTEGTIRIAVIGDSYVQASAVNVNEAFGEIIEQQLNKSGRTTEAYRFGIDGAPLTQYLYMLREEALKYNPDIVVVQLIHNDFDESYRFLYGRYSSSFMKMNLEKDPIAEVAPQPYKPGMIDTLKKSASFRYIYYQTGLSTYMRRLINMTKNEDQKDPAKQPEHGFVQSAIDVRNITELDKIRKVTAHTFKQLKTLSEKHNFKIILVMDAVREAIYAGKPATEFEANILNQIAKEEAGKLNLPFLDLESAMQKDYQENKQHFEFPWDWHWNKHGNEVVGKAIAKDIEIQFLK